MNESSLDGLDETPEATGIVGDVLERILLLPGRQGSGKMLQKVRARKIASEQDFSIITEIFKIQMHL
jgi:hypothetical protein